MRGAIRRPSLPQRFSDGNRLERARSVQTESDIDFIFILTSAVNPGDPTDGSPECRKRPKIGASSRIDGRGGRAITPGILQMAT